METFMQLLFRLYSGLSELKLFFLIFFACFCANFLFWLILERIDANVSILQRIKNNRLNYLSIIRKQIRNFREQNMSNEEIHKIIKDGFKNRSYLFMQNTSNNQTYLDDLAFVERVINNKLLLFDYIASPAFDKKLYRKILEIDSAGEKKKEAIFAIRGILLDKTPESVDAAMKWIPQLFTAPFVLDPEDNERDISKSENHFSILFYLKGCYFDDTVSQDTFIDCLKKLKKLYPQIDFAGSKSHSSEYIVKLSNKDKRKAAILDKITEIKAK